MVAVVDPRLLAKAAKPGRIRGIGLDLWSLALAKPTQVTSVLSKGLREARALHSRERRFVADTLFDLIRHRAMLTHQTGGEDPLAHWLAWLVHLGLSPEDARLELPNLLLNEIPAFETEEEAIALLGSVPPQIAASLLAAFGDQTRAFIAASNQRAPVTLRANRRRTSRAALMERLRSEGMEVEVHPHTEDGIRVVGRPNLAGSKAIKEGLFEVQDAGSQRVAALVPATGTIVDFCAGAGGKTLAIGAALAGEDSQLIAMDVRRAALEELRRRSSRAGVEVDICLIEDGPLPQELTRIRADCVLVDAPCSGLGVLRRHPEHRWRLSSVETLPAEQGRILARASTLVRPGGTLVYATCSVLLEENEQVIDAFLSQHARFTQEHALRLAPHTDDTDGFYAAVLVAR
jgi:16S rRNA (cytosine967-C5)-methyltransferase